MLTPMEPKQFLNLTVSAVTGVKELKGNKFGLELELEGRNVGLADVATGGWRRQMDGSLRGESIEYTTVGAKSFTDNVKLITNLFKKFDENKVKFNNSIRTSTHVHLNFSDRPVKSAINFFTLFTMLEEILQYYSGEDRKGNLFCISTREAEGIVEILVDAIAKGNLFEFAGDRFKYSACNLSTLFKFGTVEVRTMRGANSAEQVISWLSILNDMYVYACEVMKSPAELVQDLSLLTAKGLMNKIFKPENVRELMSTFPVFCDLHHSLMEGARILQVFAYTFNDDFLAPFDIKNVKAQKLLPKRIENGPGLGLHYQVYLPDGQLWNCANFEGTPFWQDGEGCGDRPNLKWNAALERFVFVTLGGHEIPCNWRRHHAIPDEGPPARPRQLRPAPIRQVRVDRIFMDGRDEGLEGERPLDEDEGLEVAPMLDEDEDEED